MGSRTLIQFPIFSPPAPPHNHRPLTEVRFSRWNNANAEKFIRHERAQKEIEDQIRFDKRFDSALNIANNYNPASPSPTTFKSTGTPSSPSSPSIPGKKSKYSRIYRNPNPNHPAFKSLVKTGEKTVVDDENGVNDEFPEEKSKYSRTLQKKNPYINPIHPAFRSLVRPRKIPEGTLKTEEKSVLDIKVDENGVNYEFPEAPFTYQYSYTETPKVKPKKLREPLVSPFGPESMLRPWTGRKPLPPSKKKLPEFDSFKLPPPHKKGVKPVQAPGPFLKGSGPKYVRSRDEVLGEPLTKEEIMELINSCKKTPRQMNIGRDGLTHNMLENIHAHWKRRRVCKIKCKGVCTVDMKNVCDKLEEKTGGKIIYNKGGLIYLFRGRNYNYKTRPRFPLMLWRPVTPVYPRLVKRVPEGLTLEEATEMRKKGRDLIPICKLAKNGVYCDLVKNVREALEACELVRINCQGLNPSDYRKIGAKLKDLVPCVLVSFEQEHILMWRGRDWVSFLLEDEAQPERSNGSKADIVASTSLCEEVSEMGPSSGDESEDHSSESSNEVPFDLCAATTPEMGPTSEDVSKSDSSSLLRPTPPWMEIILQLRNHAIESGSAVILDDSSLDSDIVYKTALTLSKSAPLGPVFQHRPKKVVVQRREEEETGDLKTEGIKETPTSSSKEAVVSDRKVYTRKSSRTKKLKGIREDYLNVVPKGSLGIDELAKLLA